MFVRYTKILLFFIFLTISNLAYAVDRNLVEHVKNGVVSIHKNTFLTAYGHTGESWGTGFVIDKEAGLILTNAHIAAKKDVALYEVSFFNGQKSKANYIYHDPHIDFALIKVDPKSIPAETNALKLKDQLAIGDSVFTVGNNQGQEFSVQTGTVVGLHTSTGFFPNQSIVVSTNTRGGSSGSPLVDLKGEVIGLVFSGNATYTNCIKISYITDALKALAAKKQPSRQGLALEIDYYPINDAIKFFNFPASLTKDYVKKYKDSFSKVLIINSLLKYSGLNNLLQIGDVIWSANGELIGPNLYLLQKIMNETKENFVTLGIYRHGKLLSVKAPLYDISKANNIEKLVKFGGSVFYPADDLIRLVSGVKPKSVYLSKISEGLFSELPYMFSNDEKVRRISVQSFGGKKISNLQDLIDAIPYLSKKRNFIFKFYNHSLNFNQFGYIGMQNDCLDWKEIELNTDYIEDAKVFKFDSATNDWTSSSIVINQDKNPDSK